MARRRKGSPAATEPALTKAAAEVTGDGDEAPSSEKFAELGRENLAALWRVNAALSQALEAVNHEVIGYVRSSFATAASTATALLGARTFDDVFQLNADLARANMVGLIEGTAKLSEIGAKFANEAIVPLSSRFEATMEQLARPLAA
ncbi:MAG TPA: phasin family protein [Stellaceae bacterium]|nr:phasin family protein [Stellaceae bacterium]